MDITTQNQIVQSLGEVFATTVPALVAAWVGFRIFHTRKRDHELQIAMKDILVLRKVWSEYARRYQELQEEGHSEYRQVLDSAELDLGLELSGEFTPSKIRGRFLEDKLSKTLLESIDQAFPKL